MPQRSVIRVLSSGKSCTDYCPLAGSAFAFDPTWGFFHSETLVFIGWHLHFAFLLIMVYGCQQLFPVPVDIIQRV